MNERSAIELRVAALIRAYADRAPTDVDPIAMARLAVTGSPPTAPFWFGPTHARPGLAFALLLIALLASIVSGALISGALPIRRDPVDLLVDRVVVEPFVGLPPEGAAPSSPETGELVVSFGGRVTSLGLDFHRMWLYADGRLIWKSNLEGSSEGWRLRFGSSEPTTAVIEQRLTPEGVELLRSAAIAAGLHDRRPLGPAGANMLVGRHAGVLWGGLVMRDGGRLVQAAWLDPALPGLLAVPASWLPASAWEDTRIGAYVPSRYAVCLGQGVPEGVTGLAAPDLWDLLPQPTRYLIRSKALEDPAPDWNQQDARCLYQVSTDDARAITEAFRDAGFGWAPRYPLDYSFPIGPATIGDEFSGHIELLVVLPNGETVCHCG